MAEERLKLAVFIDFDNIQIGVKDTLGKDFDVSLVLEALKERGEVVAKIAYGDWARAGEYSRQMTQHAIQMVQRSVTPRGDKNGADINLALDALEMAFTRHHINAFAIVGGDSDFMALVEKLKQFDKQVFVIGGRSFTSNILQKNCTEFVAYENLLKSDGGGRLARASRRGEASPKAVLETRSLSEALPYIQRALKILADRGVAPQLGLLKSTLLQLDSTFSERDYGAGSFLEFMQKVERAGLAQLRRTERGFLVEPAETSAEGKTSGAEETAVETAVETEPPEAAGEPETLAAPNPAALELLRQALIAAAEKLPGRPLYLRQVRQRMRSIEPSFDERRYGYRGVLDLLHHGQREGWLKLARDHRGIWRIHSLLGPAGTSEAPEPEAASQLHIEVTEQIAEQQQVPQSESAQDIAPSPEEAIAADASVIGAPETATEENPKTPPDPARKSRKPRATRVSGKLGQRKASPRRKASESKDAP
ncbi:MAG: NYN domain-containing protein [Candidatus Acidiferrales bacterium]